MIKGSAKIQLIDAKTNKIEKEVIANNMITNAYKNIMNINFNHDFFQSQSLKSNIINSYTPIIDKLIGGIMLFSDTKTEDVNNIIPKSSDIHNFIGSAGDATIRDSIYNGRLNLYETEKLSDGYKFVWDFPTNAANGTINSICLTSKEGGNAGLVKDLDNDVSTTTLLSTYAYNNNLKNLNIGFGEGNTLIPLTNLNYDGIVVGFKDANTFYTVYKPFDQNKYIITTYMVSPTIDLMDQIKTINTNHDYDDDNRGTIDYLYNLKGVKLVSQNEIDFTNKVTDVEYLRCNNNILYSIIIAENAQTSGYYIYNTSIDLTTMVKTETIINQDNYNEQYEQIVSLDTILFNNFIYYIDNNQLLHYYDITNDTINDITLDIEGSMFRLSFFLDTFAILVKNYDACDIYIYDQISNDFKFNKIALSDESYYSDAYIINLLVNNQYDKTILPCTSCESQFYTLNYSLFNAYFASINNLQTTITKTSSQVLKITYTLTFIES